MLSFVKSEKFLVGVLVGALVIGTNVFGLGSRLSAVLPRLG